MVKHLLLLTLILSCAPQGATVNTEAPVVPEEHVQDLHQETEIPPAECNCIKIFRPVCAEGRTFGNSCEAECNGFPSWTPGECK